jgi:hypothetical protein
MTNQELMVLAMLEELSQLDYAFGCGQGVGDSESVTMLGVIALSERFFGSGSILQEQAALSDAVVS